MQELADALSRYAGGLSDADALRSAFRDFLQQNPGQRTAAAGWLRERIQTGVVSPAVLGALGDLIQPAPDAAPATTIHRVERASAQPIAEGVLRAGSVLDRRYTLVEVLGRGGMSIVFKARDRYREQYQDRHPFVALKVLNEDFKRHPDAGLALQRETRRAQDLSHPHIVKVYDFQMDGPHTYMSMELLEGETLYDWLQGKSFADSSFERRWAMVRSIAEALAYAHLKGVVHSDLKPGNVFLCADGDIKVMDFGIARPLRAVAGQREEATLFDPAERLGGLTPAYASLEQWNHEAPDPRDDIYALACVTYAIFSGHHPFANASAKKAFESGLEPARLESLTRRQWEALHQALALQRKDRTASVIAFLREFAPRTWWQRHRLLLGSGAAAAGTAALVVAGFFFRNYLEDRWLRSQARPRPAVREQPLTSAQRHDIDEKLFMAKESLEEAKAAKSAADVSYLLSEGANNVNDLLTDVLKVDPANAQALQLKAAAAHIYWSTANDLYAQRQLADALRLVGFGTKVQPDSRELFRLKGDICDRDASVCNVN
jgi:serine/threonine protein kinase